MGFKTRYEEMLEPWMLQEVKAICKSASENFLKCFTYYKFMYVTEEELFGEFIGELAEYIYAQIEKKSWGFEEPIWEIILEYVYDIAEQLQLQ